ncbi:hypothetical protein SR882_08540 [Guyparkeria halophila]|uniref:DUF3592 domain-containing protein n=1 Tax=Guyparkeria halophila TaxID=47960 RepID=A0ABZ0YW54_9GAMM|nr:hypothetical protein [Guyparkeria halophila]WQH15804.1 hypothetical protein SR882_08540 [Guyparkeria halophila]
MVKNILNYFHLVFVERALRNRVSILMYWFSGFFLLLAVIWAIDALNAVPGLDEMDVTTGVVKEVNLRWQTRCGANIHLALDDGEIVKFHGCLTNEQQALILGERVKIWSQPYVDFFYGSTDYLNQIKVGENLVKDWSEIKPHRVRSYKSIPVEMTVFFVLALLPIVYVWFKHRRGPDQQGGGVGPG